MGPPGEFFGERRLEQTLAGHATRPAADIARAIEEKVLDFIADGPSDDMAILIPKASGR